MSDIAVTAPRKPDRKTPIPLSAACGLAVVSAVTTLALPDLPAAQDYTKGYAPWWIVLVAAGLMIVARRPPTARPMVGIRMGWVAAALMLWAAAGFVLDAFRAFFAVAGIPAGDFATVDWPGFAARTFALMATGVIVADTVARQRVMRSAAGPTHTDNGWPRATLIAAVTAIWVYPALKIQWWLGGTFLVPDGPVGHAPSWTVVTSLAATVIMVMLAARRGLPRWMLLAGGVALTAPLLCMGALSGFGIATQVLGLADGPVPLDAASIATVGTVYGSWLVAGLLTARLLLRYQATTGRYPVTAN